jgi:ATP phosphoribosyltransferase
MAARARGRSMGNMAAIPSENLLLAVPKKGRLNEKVMKLLVDGVGMDYKRPDRVDVAHCTNMPVCPFGFPSEQICSQALFCASRSNIGNMQVTLVFLPAHDIATYVGEGNVDMGITGEDVLTDFHKILQKLWPPV